MDFLRKYSTKSVITRDPPSQLSRPTTECLEASHISLGIALVHIKTATQTPSSSESLTSMMITIHQLKNSITLETMLFFATKFIVPPSEADMTFTCPTTATKTTAAIQILATHTRPLKELPMTQMQP